MPIVVISKGFQRASILSVMQMLDEYTETALYIPYVQNVTSTHAQETLEFNLGVMGVREWIGERVFHERQKADFTVVNRNWELSHWWNTDNVSDNPEIIADGLPAFSQSAADHPSGLLFNMLVNGTAGLCYDGKAFFAVDHPSYFKDETYSNIKTGSGITAANIIADYNAVILVFRRMKKANGNPLFQRGIEIDVIHPPELNPLMKEVFVNEETSVGAKNPNMGAATPIPAPWLTDTNDYYYLVKSLVQKPFLFQRRERFTAEFSEDKRKSKRLFLLGDGRYAIAYAHPQLAVKVTNS
jgi:phage major head subunit gpT-like protein